jgi:hypothetical protein
MRLADGEEVREKSGFDLATEFAFDILASASNLGHGWAGDQENVANQ